METPKSNSRRINPRKYVPTPKMSERKKSLFRTRSAERSPSLSLRDESDNDSDLGVMSPLDCSSNSSVYDSDGKLISFKKFNFDKKKFHIFSDSGHLSPIHSSHRRSFQSRFTNSGKYEFLSSSLKPTLSDLTEEEQEMQTPTKIRLTNTWIDMSQVTDLSAPIVLLTPNDTSTKEKVPKSSFRKSMIDKNGDTTPQVEDQTVKRHRSPEKTEKDPKARTSLFNESIPTKSFYSHTASSEDKTQADLNCSILGVIRKSINPIYKSMKVRKHKRSNYRPARKSDINRGVFHKIHKQRPKKSAKVTSTKVKKERILEAAIEIIDKELDERSSDEENDFQNRHRVQNILRNMKNPIELARPLNIELANNINAGIVSDESENEGSPPILQKILNSPDPSPVEENKSRKFFKAKTEKRAKYEIIKGVSAILDQGKLSLEKSEEKPKKRKLRSLFEDDTEFGQEQQEVDQILKNFDGKQQRNVLQEKNILTSPTTNQISSLATKFAALNSSDTETRVFPVFQKGQTNAYVSTEPQPKRMKVSEWRPIGDNQLQIDAGQKAFGAIECKTCGFTYTVSN